MNTQTATAQNTNISAQLIALMQQIDPNISQERIDQLLAESAPSFAPVKKEIKAIAKASEVLENALAHGDALQSAALRPSRGSRLNRWVINFTFTQWANALTFAQFWGKKMNLNFQIQRLARDQFGVSIPLVHPPTNQVTVAARFDRDGAAQSFAKALKGLSV